MSHENLNNLRVLIWGLGMMGGSLALALKGKCMELMAIDKDPETVNEALAQSIVGKADTQPDNLLAVADVIILAAPVGEIINIVTKLPELHPGNPFLMDIGSTKRRICEVYERLPDRFDVIGGHPMCGKEKLGLLNAEAEIYQNATFVFTPLARTSGRARQLAEQLACAVGAISVWLDPDTHDRWVAGTSHLPYLVAMTLVLATPLEASALIGPGFRSVTRLAGTPDTMMWDVLSTNRDHVLNALNTLTDVMAGVEDLLKKHCDEDLRKQMRFAREQQEILIERK